MAARLLGMTQAITRAAASLRKSSRATCPTAWWVVRSPIPINTTPSPIGMTSPPSILQPAVSSSVSPNQIWKSPALNSGWNLYTARCSRVSGWRAGQNIGLQVTPP